MPFLCVDFLAVGVFQTCGMGRRALAFAIMRKIVLEIPALVVWNAVLPLYGLGYARPRRKWSCRPADFCTSWKA